jgi:hypothetical protein
MIAQHAIVVSEIKSISFGPLCWQVRICHDGDEKGYTEFPVDHVYNAPRHCRLVIDLPALGQENQHDRIKKSTQR